MPPLTPPSDATGNPAMLELQDCTSNDTDTGLLTPVKKFVDDIRALKGDPDSQILVAAIAAPTTPYGEVWTTGPGQNNEAWPAIMHSCGTGPGVTNPSAEATTDGSFGDPAVRIHQFVDGFQDSIFFSVCEPSYAGSMSAIAKRITQKFAPPCVTGKIATTAAGTPDCTVTDHVYDSTDKTWQDQVLKNCDQNGGQAPCWRLQPGDNMTCTGQVLAVTETDANKTATTLERSMECVLCLPGTSQPGCN
jgi:hypothetical protein